MNLKPHLTTPINTNATGGSLWGCQEPCFSKDLVYQVLNQCRCTSGPACPGWEHKQSQSFIMHLFASNFQAKAMCEETEFDRTTIIDSCIAPTMYYACHACARAHNAVVSRCRSCTATCSWRCPCEAAPRHCSMCASMLNKEIRSVSKNPAVWNSTSMHGLPVSFSRFSGVVVTIKGKCECFLRLINIFLLRSNTIRQDHDC